MQFPSKIGKTFLLTVVLFAITLCGNIHYSYSLPEGAQIQEGTANFDQPNSSTLNITTSDQAIINWNSFNIALNETVNFIQPLSSSAVLNRVVGGGISEIAGALNANGTVILVNPAGINLGPTASVNVGSLIASSLNITNENFMAGHYVFENESGLRAGTVINAGNITTIRPGGIVAMLGSVVENSGSIVAELGSVALASGNKITLSFDPDGFLKADVTEGVSDGLFGADAVHNIGRIIASGGKVILTGEQVSNIFQRLVNQEGYIEADSVLNQAGHILLVSNSGLVRNAGELHVEGLLSGTSGGRIEVLGREVRLDDGVVAASGYSGGGTLLIGGDFQGGGGVPRAVHTYVSNNSLIKADAIHSGQGGKVIVWSDLSTLYYGNISARGGSQSGNGGFAEVSGKDYLDFDGHVDLTSAHGTTGTLLLDPNNYVISTGANFNTTLVTPFTTTGNSAVLNTATLVAALGLANVTVQTGTSAPNNQAGNLTVANSFSAPANSNNLTLQAHNNIRINNGVTINMSASSGNLTLIADSDLSGAGAISRAGTGTIAMGTGTLTMTAGSGIGTNAAPIQTTGLTNVSATTRTGGIFVSNSTSGNINITGASTTTGSAAPGGNISFRNNVVGGSIAVSGAITGGANAAGSTGNVLLTANGGNIIVNANITTGNATLADAGGGQNPVSGNIVINTGAGAGNVTGSGALITGSSSLTGATAGGSDTATSGSITITAAGGIGLSNANALRTGAASRTGAGAGTDTATVGNITLTSANEINNGTASTAMGIIINTATGATTLNQGRLNVTTTQTSGNIFITSGSTLRLGTLATTAGSSQTLNIGVTGAATSLTALNVAETLSGDNVTLTTATGTGILTIANASFTIGTGNLTITSDEIDFTGGANSIIGSGNIVLQPAAAGVSVGVGGGAGTLNISATDIAAMANGWTSIAIGRADSTALMTINASTFVDPVTFQMGGVSGDITLSGALTTAASNSAITFIAGTGNGGTFTQTAGAGNTIASGTGAISITADTIVLNTTANTITGTGTLTLQPSTAARPIVIGAAGAATDFALSTTEVAAITNGFSSITIGRTADGTGTVTVAGNVSITDNVTFVGGAIASNATLTSTGNTVTFTARTGNITDGNGATNNVSASSATFSAVTGIGSADAIETAVTTLSVTNSTSGNIQVTDADGVSVSGSNTGGGSVNITAGGAGNTLIVNAANLTANTGSVTLAADEMTLTGTVTGNGGVTLRPNTAGTVITLGTGAGGLNLTDAALDQVFTTGTLTIGSSTAGSITIDAAVNANNASNMALVTGGDVTFAAAGALTSSGTVTVTAASGAVIGNSSATTNISGTTLTINSANGIGSANTFSTSVTSLSATNSTSGNVNITESTGLDITGITNSPAGGGIAVSTTAGSLTTSGAISATGAGTVSLTALGAASSLTLNSSVTSGSGSVTFTAQNGITLSGAGADVTTTGAYTVNADSDSNGTGNYSQDNAGSAVSSGAVTIQSGTQITLTGTINAGSASVLLLPSRNSATMGVEDASKNFNITDATLDNISTTGVITIGNSSRTAGITIGTNATLTQGAKNYAFVTGGNITVGGNNFTTTGNVTMTADADGNATGAITTGAGVVAANLLTASAAQGITLGTNVTSLNLTNTTSGNILITEANGATLTNITTGGGGQVTVTSTAGDLLVGTVNAGAGNVNLTASTGDLLDSASDIIGNVVTLIAGGADGDVGIAGSPLNTCTSTLNATAAGTGEIAITNCDTLTLNGIITGGGDVSFDVLTGDIFVGIINAGAGNVTLTTPDGSILDAGSLITANTLSLNADVDIGQTGAAINTTVTTINASSTGSGEIVLNETDGATLANVTTADGDISITSTAGDLSITTVDAGASNVTLTALAGDLLDAASLITGDTVTLTAGGADGDVGVTGAALNTTAATINATATGTGEIVINETNGATLAGVTTAGGQITVRSTTGDLSVTTVNAGAGNVTLTATGGDILDAGSLITGNVVTLSAGGADGDVGQTGAALNTAAGSIVATATGTGEIVINELNAVTLTGLTTAGGNVTVSAGGNMTLGVVSGGFVGLTTTAGGSILDGNGILNNLTATAGASLNSAGIIGTALDPLEVTVSGGNLTIAAAGVDLLTGISVNINGTVVPSGTLTVPVRPTGRVFFNGVDLFAPGTILLVTIDGNIVFVNLQERFRERDQLKDILAATTDPFVDKKRWSLAARSQYYRQQT